MSHVDRWPDWEGSRDRVAWLPPEAVQEFVAKIGLK